MSEMPLPMPRWVISSPSHMSRVAPAVSEITISITLPKLSVPSITSVPPKPEELKRKT